MEILEFALYTAYNVETSASSLDKYQLDPGLEAVEALCQGSVHDKGY